MGANASMRTRTASNYTVVATGTGNQVVWGNPGVLSKIIVTTAGTGAGSVTFYDNATTNSGNVIAAIPATVAVGLVYDVQVPVGNGIVAVNVANGPALAVTYDGQ